MNKLHSLTFFRKEMRNGNAFELHQQEKQIDLNCQIFHAQFHLFILEKQKHNIERLTKTIERKTYLDCSHDLSNLCLVKLRCRPGLLLVHQLITLLSFKKSEIKRKAKYDIKCNA